MLASKKKKFSTLAADYYGWINGRRRRASNTKDEREPKQGRGHDFCGALLFHQSRYAEDEDHGFVS